MFELCWGRGKSHFTGVNHFLYGTIQASCSSACSWQLLNGGCFSSEKKKKSIHFFPICRYQHLFNFIKESVTPFCLFSRHLRIRIVGFCWWGMISTVVILWKIEFYFFFHFFEENGLNIRAVSFPFWKISFSPRSCCFTSAGEINKYDCFRVSLVIYF